ncbi:MAG: hypothetical protein ACPGVU_05355 [Limisphaerales bacterium]
MAEEEMITIACPFCRGGIYYPAEREGEETTCPHCSEPVFLLSKDLPPPPEPDQMAAVTETAENEEGPKLHAATMQRLGERKATIKAEQANPAATPPNRKKICTPESSVAKINHIFDPVDLDKEGNHNSVQVVYRHPDEFTLSKKGGLMSKKTSNWTLHWTVVLPQKRGSKPWAALELTAKADQEIVTRGCEMRVGEQVFDFETDSECARKSGKGTDLLSDKNVNERFSFEHDCFRFLCGELVLNESYEMKFDGADFEIPEARRADFREYTIEFFEALRRELPLFFR